MSAGIPPVARLNRLLARYSLIPALFSSSVALTLFAGRVIHSHSLGYRFLVWNLFLAWVPYASSLWAAWLHQRHPGRWWVLILPGALWLIFFPNAPYIVTDFVNLSVQAPVPIWYDIGMLAIFAWSGLFLAVFSLRHMQRLVRHYLGTVASRFFAASVIGLGGLGVYLGRFLRWNSWDLLLNPKGVLSDVAVRLTEPWAHPQTIGVTILVAAILSVCYVTLASREAV